MKSKRVRKLKFPAAIQNGASKKVEKYVPILPCFFCFGFNHSFIHS